MDYSSPQIRPPANSTIQLAEASAARLVFAIPPSSSLGRRFAVFAAIWCVVTAICSGGLVGLFFGDAANLAKQPEPPPLWFVIPFLSLFWLVGIGFAYAALRMCFTRTLVAVEPNQFAIRWQWFGRERTSCVSLNAGACAHRTLAYHDKLRSVYRITVVGEEGPLNFGLGMSDAEQDWLIDNINSFLGVPSPPRQTEHSEPFEPAIGLAAAEGQEEEQGGDEAQAPGETEAALAFNRQRFVVDERIEPLAPSDLAPDSRVSFEALKPDKLEVSYFILRSYRPVIIPLVFVGLFELMWVIFIAAVFFDAIKGNGAALQMVSIFPVFLLVIGAVPAVLMWSVVKAKVTVTLTTNEVTARAGTLAFGYERTIPLSSVLDIGLGHPETESGEVSRAGNWPSNAAVVIWSSVTTLPVAFSDDESFRRELAGAISHCLQQLRSAQTT